MHPEHPSKFGAYAPVYPFGDGRFGPVFLAKRPDSVTVIVRTFTIPLSDAQRDRLVAALTALCGRPLEHPSIARPLACGIEDGRPYLVHTCLPGDSLADLAHSARPFALADISVYLTSLAGALDFAAAAGVLHGALSAHDVIVSNEDAGVSGLGLVQALESAGIPGFHAEREDDVAALIGIARDLVGEDASPAVTAVLSAPPPLTALVFAAELQGTLPFVAPVATPAIEDLFHRETISAPKFDAPLPEEHIPLRPEDPLLKAEESLQRADDTLRTAGTLSEDTLLRPEDTVLRPQDTLLRPQDTLLRPEDNLVSAEDTLLRPEGTPAPEPPLRPDIGFSQLDDLAPMSDESEPLSGERPMFGATQTDIAAVALPVRGRTSRWLVTAAVVLALAVAGFAGGLFFGRDTPQPADATTPQPAPAATNGQNFTDAAVDESKPPAPASPAPSPAASGPASPVPGSSAPSAAAPLPQRSAGARTVPGPAPSTSPRGADPSARSESSRSQGGSDNNGATPSQPSPRASAAQTAPGRPSGPAAMQVDSRPAGAQVFVDGRSVGYTPMVVADLPPGTHSVRMQIPGYRPWVTAVTLGPGARERVAASLEQ